MAELKFEITERIGVLSENAKGWTKELNKVSWNEREPKYDLRECHAVPYNYNSLRIYYYLPCTFKAFRVL